MLDKWFMKLYSAHSLCSESQKARWRWKAGGFQHVMNYKTTATHCGCILPPVRGLHVAAAAHRKNELAVTRMASQFPSLYYILTYVQNLCISL